MLEIDEIVSKVEDTSEIEDMSEAEIEKMSELGAIDRRWLARALEIVEERKRAKEKSTEPVVTEMTETAGATERKRKPKRLVENHHLLYQARYWKKGYAKALREDPYFQIVIPSKLHHYIHKVILKIAVPDFAACASTYALLTRYRSEGVITDKDDVTFRLAFLINEWKDSFPKTTAMLREQTWIFSRYLTLSSNLKTL